MANGRHSYADPIWRWNRPLRSCYAVVDGQPAFHPEGVFYLLYLSNRKGSVAKSLCQSEDGLNASGVDDVRVQVASV
jgi:hypothetical protein